MKASDLLTGEVKLSRLPINTSYDIEFNCEQEWMQKLLEELEQVASFDTGIDLEKGFVTITASVARKHTQDYGDFLTFQGAIKAEYYSPCVRCLKPTMQSIDCEFATCAISVDYENTPEFADTNSLYLENGEFDLYFYKKGVIDLREIVQEQLFMNVNPLPLHDEECKGLCPICGIDKNTEECEH